MVQPEIQVISQDPEWAKRRVVDFVAEGCRSALAAEI
jgi:hypothetical protein